MAAFTELHWQRLDVWAIAGNGGLATINAEQHDACRQWLIRNGYTLDTLDCAQPLQTVEGALRELLHWEQQFGYSPKTGRFSLDALRDGFNFDIPEAGGHVLELAGVDVLWQQKPDGSESSEAVQHWVRSLLSIAQEYSRWELALGRRFFVLLVVEAQSPLIGTTIETTRVPYVFRPPYEPVHRPER